MRLSKKTDYALRALVTLAEHWDKGLVSIRELAAHNQVPRRFLEQIMLGLKDLGWVRGIPGRDGGYQLTLHPSQLTMGQVVRHFDGVLAPIGCVSVSHYEGCSQEAVCRFRRVLLEVRNETAKRLDFLSLAELLTLSPLAVGERNVGFADGAGI